MQLQGGNYMGAVELPKTRYTINALGQFSIIKSLAPSNVLREVDTSSNKNIIFEFSNKGLSIILKFIDSLCFPAGVGLDFQRCCCIFL